MKMAESISVGVAGVLGGTTAISGGVVLGTNLSGRTVTNLSISAAGISITLV